jgi:hypothetical protein
MKIKLNKQNIFGLSFLPYATTASSSIIHFDNCNYLNKEGFHTYKLCSLMYCNLYVVLHISAVRCYQIHLQSLHNTKHRYLIYTSVCMTHGYWQYCTICLLFKYHNDKHMYVRVCKVTWLLTLMLIAIATET